MKKMISIFLALVLVTSFVTMAFAKAEPSAKVYVTICSEGSFAEAKDDETVVAYPINVTDENKNGKLDIDDALYCAHEYFFEGGAAAGYASAKTDYGQSITKLWGDESGAFGYYLNDAMVMTDVYEEVKDNDRLTAYVFADQVNWSDTYTYFAAIPNGGTCVAGEDVELVLMQDVWGTPAPLAGAKVYLNGGEICTTDELGHVKFKADTTGRYYLTATAENMTIVPPYCKLIAIDASVRAFADVAPSAWYAADVAYTAKNGLLRGTSEGVFSPDATMTRAMIVTCLYRLAGEPAFMNDNIFNDVARGSYYEKAVIWAQGKGIVKGVSDSSFAPNAEITREQLAAILYRYAQYMGYDVSVGEDTNILSYDDAFSVSEYAYASLQWACGAGIIGGIGTNLVPAGNATRAQVAAILHRFCEAYEK